MDRQIVTGAKIFARDLRAHDIKNIKDYKGANWGEKTWRAMFVRAQRLGRVVEGIDIDATRKVGAIKCFVKLSNVANDRESFEDILGSGEKIDFKDPDDDYLVTIGETARYVGQPVCLLVFDDVASFLDAQREKEALSTILRLSKQSTNRADGFESISLMEYAARMFDQDNWPPEDTPTDKWSTITFKDNKGNILKKGRYDPEMAKCLEQHHDQLINLVTTTPAIDVAYLEPDSSLGRVVHRGDGQKVVELIVPTQSHYQDYISLTTRNTIYGYEFELLPCSLGGGFGGRSSSPFPVYAALAAVAGNGIPVRLEYDRIEQFVSGIKRHPSRMETSIVVSNDGTLDAVDARLILDGGSVINLSASVLGLSTHSSSGAYRYKQRAYRGVPLKNSGVISGSMRGFGIPQALFNIEQQIDRIAAQLRRDPLKYREEIVLVSGDTDIDGKILSHPLKNKAVLASARVTKHWQERQLRRLSFLSDPCNKDRSFGTGLAFVMEAYGTSTDSPAAAIHLTKDLVIEVDCFPVRMGQGTINGIEKYLQSIFSGVIIKVNSGKGVFLGKALRAKGDEILRNIDTNAAAKGTFGSIHVIDNLVEIWIRHVWAPELANYWKNAGEIDPKKIQFLDDGTITYEGQAPISFDSVAKSIAESDRASIYGSATFRNTWAYGEFYINSNQAPEPRWLDRLAFGPNSQNLNDIKPILATNVIDPTSKNVLSTQDSPTRSLYASAACMVDVVVDVQGHVELKKVTVVLDAGHRLNDHRIRQQIEGGIAQGIGHTLLESYPSGPLGGQLNINFDHYPLPRVRHMPEQGIETVFVDIEDDEYVLNPVSNNLGIKPKIDPPHRLYKGIAEVSISPIAPAIANAIINAVFNDPVEAHDHRFTRWPITTSDVRERMEIANDR